MFTMQQEEYIDKLKKHTDNTVWQGYIWFENANSPILIQGQEIDWKQQFEQSKNALFLSEAMLVSGDISFTFRTINGELKVQKDNGIQELRNNKENTIQTILKNKQDTHISLCAKFKDVKDPFCDGFTERRFERFVFLGITNNSSNAS